MSPSVGLGRGMGGMGPVGGDGPACPDPCDPALRAPAVVVPVCVSVPKDAVPPGNGSSSEAEAEPRNEDPRPPGGGRPRARRRLRRERAHVLRLRLHHILLELRHLRHLLVGHPSGSRGGVGAPLTHRRSSLMGGDPSAAHTARGPPRGSGSAPGSLRSSHHVRLHLRHLHGVLGAVRVRERAGVAAVAVRVGRAVRVRRPSARVKRG